MIQMTEKPIPVLQIQQSLSDPSCGAFVDFKGIVRNHNEGRTVSRLLYEAYPEMAFSLLEKIAQEAREDWPVREIVLIHRIGELKIGEVALYVAILAPHRREAFEACRFIIDEVKQRVPIWKKEFYVDETEGHWVDCCHE